MLKKPKFEFGKLMELPGKDGYFGNILGRKKEQNTEQADGCEPRIIKSENLTSDFIMTSDS